MKMILKKSVTLLMIMSLLLSMCVEVSAIDSENGSFNPFPHKQFNSICDCCDCNHGCHDFTWDDKITDVCNKCGYEQIHETNILLPFLAYDDGIVARTEPRKTGYFTRMLSFEEPVSINGRIRNEKNHVWCRTENNDYIYVDNLVFDFDAMTVEAYQQSCANLGIDNPAALQSMYELFCTGGTLDLKNIHMLGNANNQYKIRVQGNVLPEYYTGEELGNILYGFCVAELGLDQDTALRIGGGAADLTSDQFEKILKGTICLVSGKMCDDDDDRKNIIKGMLYYETGEWYNDADDM